MFGKHYDTRVSQNFVHTYTRVPYLDTEIFNIEVQGLKESRRTRDRTCRVIESIDFFRFHRPRTNKGEIRTLIR